MRNNQFDIALIRKYLNGELDAQAMYQLERQAQEDPALMDVIAGMEAGDRDMDEANLFEIHDLIKTRVEQHNNIKVISWKGWAVAASLVFISILAGLLVFRIPKQTAPQQVKIEKKPTIQVPNKPEVVSTQKKGSQLPATPASKFNKANTKRDQTTAKPDTTVLPVELTYALNNNTSPIRPLAPLPTQPSASTALAGRVAGVTIQAPDSAIIAALAAQKKWDMMAEGAMLNEVVVASAPRAKKANSTSAMTVVRGKTTVSTDSPSPANFQKLTEAFIDTAALEGKASPVIGWSAYHKYLKNGAHAPDGTKGKVELAFYIDHNGKPVNIKVVKSLTLQADQTAILLVMMGSRWAGDKEQLPKKVILKIRFN